MGNEAAYLLEMVVRDLRSHGIPVTLLGSDPSLALQIGDDENRVIAIAVHDPARPSFSVSYPALIVKRGGDRHIETVQASGVLFAALLWIARELVSSSAVRPEHG